MSKLFRRPATPGVSLRSDLPDRRAAGLLCWLGLAALLAGCSDGDGRVPVYPVKGKVTVAGEVPEGALLVLYPAARGGENELRPSAKVKHDGSFHLTTYEADDGAPSGEYTATIQWNKLIKRGQDYVGGPNVIDKRYTSRDTSPWKVTVTTGPNELPPIEIKKQAN